MDATHTGLSNFQFSKSLYRVRLLATAAALTGTVAGCRASEPPLCSDPAVTQQIVGAARNSLNEAMKQAAAQNPEIQEDIEEVRVTIDQFVPLQANESARACSAQLDLFMGSFLGHQTIAVEYATVRSEDGQSLARMNWQNLQTQAENAPSAAMVMKVLGLPIGGR